MTGNLFVAAAATLVTSGAAAIGKASLDASLQDDLPERSRASAFGRSESLLQLAWVAGGATGVLIYTDLWVGLHGDHRGADPRTGADGGELPRRVVDPRPRRQPSGAGRAGGRATRAGGAAVKRVLAVLAVVVVVASLGTGVLIWRLAQQPRQEHPEISAYSQGHLTRVGPYLYCDVNDFNKCENPQTVGQLAVDGRHPVQLSVPPAIARAPWLLGRAYEDSDVVDEFRPDSTLAVTIPTVDPHRGKLTRIVVQLPTIVIDAEGNERPSWHAEWSIETVWPQPAP